MSLSLRSAIASARTRLREAGIESADLDARLLAQHVTGYTREELLLHSEEILDEDKKKLLDSCLARRLGREPVSRITGRKAFWKSDFKVTPQTLDPRPDSETLVEAALRHAENPRHILDLGTGSGCLLLSLLQEWPGARGTGIDASAGAVETARENASALGLADRADFAVADWADYDPPRKYDLVVANPPYIAQDERAALAPEVALHDPPLALFAGEGGLAAYRAITGRLRAFLVPSGLFFLEIGHTQAGAVKDMLEQARFTVLETATDLAGSDRCIVGRA